MFHLPPIIASFIFIVGMAGLFVFGHDRNCRTSKALWIPVVYLLIISSRPVSEWLGITAVAPASQVYMEGSPVDRFVFILLLIAALIVLISRGKQVGPLLRRNGPILFFFSYSALSVLWSEFPFVTLKHWSKGVGDAMMVLIVLTDLEPSAAIKRVLARTGFILIPLSLLLSKYYPQSGRVLSRGGSMEFAGVMMQKNALGMVCLVLGLGHAWLFRAAYRDRENPQRTRSLAAHGALLVFVVWLLWMSNSMTSLACFTMAVALMVVATRPAFRRKPSRVHLPVAGLVGISLVALFFDRNMVTLLGRDPTLTGRTEIWDAVLSLPHNPVVGAGYESFFLGTRLEEFWTIPGMNEIQEAHNGYLEVYLNLGWIGVSLFAIVMVTGYRKIVAAFRQNPEAGSLNLAYFVAAVIYSFTEAGFRMQTLTWIFFLWAIIAASQVSPHEALATPTRQTGDSVDYEPQVDPVFGGGFHRRSALSHLEGAPAS